MLKIKKFTFNPFQENTYVLINELKECIIVDPGCFSREEEAQLSKFIEKENLTPIKVINTHAHIDHVLGNNFVCTKYKINLSLFKSDYNMLEMAERSATMYGVPYTPSPEPSEFLQDGESLQFGEVEFEFIHVPGHAPDHIVLFSKNSKVLIGGDVLFKGSIGRTDLPGGNHDELINNIRKKVFTLPSDTIVYSGHGAETTVGEEKDTNPFFI